MKKIIPGIALCLFFFSCEKEELPVAPHEAGTAITSTVNMDASYKWQIYFDLETNRVVGQSLKTSWDLGFETSVDGFHVIVNSAKSMFVLNTGDTSFVSLTDTSGFALGKTWDASSGNMDSTAIRDWTVAHNTYIVDRGYNENGQHQGFRKVRFENVTATAYSVRFANMNGTGEAVVSVPKDSLYNFTFLSLTGTGGIISVEPPKHDWDLVFSQYTYIFHDPFQPYLVTGCLLNRYQTTAARDSLSAFNDITFQSLSNFNLVNSIDIIGYDWKVFDGVSYVTDPTINFIILDQHGYYYKLHFLDFYDAGGVKGNPKWEFQRL